MATLFTMQGASASGQYQVATIQSGVFGEPGLAFIHKTLLRIALAHHIRSGALAKQSLW